MAVEGNTASSSRQRTRGVLPLVHMKHFLFGHQLISMPYFDMGGILADSAAVERALLKKAIEIGRRLGVDGIELRHRNPRYPGREPAGSSPATASAAYERHRPGTDPPPAHCTTQSHKVRMLLELPDTSEALMKSFKSKLRSQIKKPVREGLTAVVGRDDLLDDFYAVFAVNMRDLGSPVHSRKLLENVLKAFPDTARIVMVYRRSTPVAGSVVIGFGETMENPWASSLREYSRLAPNMLLYWAMLDYACSRGYRVFDFGRSTPEEGTYKFKKQWGAGPHPLHWHTVAVGSAGLPAPSIQKTKYDRAIRYWQKLPVPLTVMIGPRVRKHIAL